MNTDERAADYDIDRGWKLMEKSMDAEHARGEDMRATLAVLGER